MKIIEINAKRFLMILLASVCLVFGGKYGILITQAGGLNVYEQDVVNQARGTFGWNGTSYQAKPEFVDMLIEYLCEDDVDLNADTCHSALQKMYASVEQGVTEGYLYAVDGAEGENARDTEEEQSEQVKTSEPESERTSPDTEPAISDEKEETEKKNNVPSIFAALSREDISDMEIGSYGEDAFTASMQKIVNPGEVYRIVYYAVILSIIFLTGVVFTGLVFQLFRKHRKRKLRNNLRRVTGLVVAVSWMILSGIATWKVCFFSSSSVLNQIEKTSYYETVYEEVRMAAALALNRIGVPTDVVSEGLPYERVVMDARQQVEAGLKGHGYEADTSIMRNYMEEKVMNCLLETYPDGPEIRDGTAVLMDGVEQHYRSCLAWAGENSWRVEREIFGNLAKQAFLYSLILIAGGMVVLYGLSHYKYRAVRMMGQAIVLGSVGCILLILVETGIIGAHNMSIQPVYMKELIEQLSMNSMFTAVLIGGAGICAGGLFLYKAKLMKERRDGRDGS